MAKPRPFLMGCLILAGVIIAVALICVCITSLIDSNCPEGSFSNAAVAADSLICSEIGRKMLQQGGSAVDGAIAALLCTSVVNPQSMGIGGGSIVTVRSATGHYQVYNFRETVPRSVKANLLKECPTTFSFSTGPQWIGVPGELRGYETLHKQYGKLPWAKLFEPTVQMARDGIPLPVYLTNFMKADIVKDYVEKSSLCGILCNKNKTVLGKGDTLKFTKLAETLEAIAMKGADEFYAGRIGHDLVHDIKAAGGALNMEDLKSFKVKVENTWAVPLGETTIHIPPPPAGGTLLAFILKIMQGFALTPNSFVGDHKTQTYHHYIEAAKFANGQKRNIRDPAFHSKKSVDHLIDASFTNRIRKMISPNRTHDNSYYKNINPSSDHFGTTHVSVIDKDGLSVSATSTINQLFGGAVYSPRTGIILNNELADFCGRADTLTAGEQPPSSMTPMIVEWTSGDFLVIGGSGGSLITTSVALTIINHLWLGMNLKDAINAPIVFIDSLNNVNFEPGFDKSVIDSLRVLGHNLGKWKFFLNVVNAVKKEKSCIVAVSDSRKMGASAGY
ncbi:glutathione hydrolase 5 proenzyme [Gouania willdenowi]|uniref:Glutathione hydrolase n=1 Tax=Gouania willdenowi TaxID=441366 RepID=A0A8C5HFL7_GOUWI|nr:glutathione hydrolase 5 proenzyme-like [Gouania willdenowi]